MRILLAALLALPLTACEVQVKPGIKFQPPIKIGPENNKHHKRDKWDCKTRVERNHKGNRVKETRCR